jgi:hypothetical protein
MFCLKYNIEFFGKIVARNSQKTLIYLNNNYKINPFF